MCDIWQEQLDCPVFADTMFREVFPVIPPAGARGPRAPYKRGPCREMVAVDMFGMRYYDLCVSKKKDFELAFTVIEWLKFGGHAGVVDSWDAAEPGCAVEDNELVLFSWQGYPRWPGIVVKPRPKKDFIAGKGDFYPPERKIFNHTFTMARRRPLKVGKKDFYEVQVRGQWYAATLTHINRERKTVDAVYYRPHLCDLQPPMRVEEHNLDRSRVREIQMNKGVKKRQSRTAGAQKVAVAKVKQVKVIPYRGPFNLKPSRRRPARKRRRPRCPVGNLTPNPTQLGGAMQRMHRNMRIIS